MIQRNKIISGLLASVLSLCSISSWGAGVGDDDNPSSISATFKAFNSPTPQIITTRTPYGGRLCTLSSEKNGFKAALAKWRSPNIAGSISDGGYTYEIQRTNIPGVGAIARLEGIFIENQLGKATQVIGAIYKPITATVSSGAKAVFFGSKYWALVSIPGEPMVPGSYNLGKAETMVDVWCQAIDASNDTHGGGSLTGTVVINAPTCSLSSDVSSVMTLDLGQYQWIDVRNLSVGSNFGSVYKTLSMQCDAGTWPKLTISDKNDNSNNSTIISLTNPSASTTAKGVGVQVFINNQSIAQPLASKVNLTPNQLNKETQVDLPLQFKYIKTSDPVSAGEANAIVDLTFTYD